MAVTIYAHLSWTTLDREAMIGAAESEFLHGFLRARCETQKVELIALGTVSDHLHMIVRLPAQLDIPKLVQGLKGASARIANRDLEVSTTGLRWARGYDLRSVSPRNLGAAVAYVKAQSQRHPDRSVSAVGIESSGPRAVDPCVEERVLGTAD